MTRPSQDAIDTFMRVTGASESLALRKLEEYGGNLDLAVNAHFIEVEGHIRNQIPTVSSQSDSVDTRNQMLGGPSGFPPLLSAARSFKPSLLLDPSYRRDLYSQIGSSLFTGPKPVHPQAGESQHGYGQPYHPEQRPAIRDVSGNSMSHSPQIHGRDGIPHMYSNDVEEEMMQLAIEASKREIKKDNHDKKESSGTGISPSHIHLDDEDFARAVSLSLKTAEQEKAMREKPVENLNQQSGIPSSSRRSEKIINDESKKLKPGSSSLLEGAANVQEHPMWGGISPRELDEAILLEEALFGGMPERNAPQHSSHLEYVPDKGLNPQHVPALPSTSLGSQQLLLQQQDNEYLASLLSDREKEARALKDANPSCLKEEESQNKTLEEEELSRSLTAKETSLPPEPAVDNENAVTLVIRMPDGSRCGRRFLTSDKLQLLLDFIEVLRAVKPRTYRVVRPYPKCVFSHDDSSVSLHELGLTNKQEALFLEMV